MEELYRELEKVVAGQEPLMVAGVMMAQALKIYKTLLDEDEFERMTRHVLTSRDDIIASEKPTLN
jgi:hypothetical protein